MPYWMYDLQFYRLPFHFVNCFCFCAETFWFDIVPLVCFYFCCLCFWCQIKKKKIIAKNHCQGDYPLFSSGSLTVSGITCKSLIHLDIDFGVWHTMSQILFFCRGYPVFPTPFIEKNILEFPSWLSRNKSD